MTKFLFFLLSSAFAIALATSNVVPGANRSIEKVHWNATGNGGFQPKAKFRIGVANGVTFFGDRTTRRNWAQAKFFCEGESMRLASIEDQTEQNMLNDAFSAGSFDGEFWTSGKDARELRQFTWEDGVDPPDDFYSGQFDFYGVPITTERCLTYQSRPTGLMSHLNSYPCSQQHFVLCISGERP